MSSKPKLIRITTIPVSLSKLIKGQMRYMSDYYEVIGVSSSGEALQDVSERERVRVKPLEMSRKIDLARDIRSLIKMYLFLRKEKPQIVHTHTPKAGTVGMLAAWLARVPVRMHTVAGMPLVEARGLKRLLLNSVERITYSCATMVYPNSRGMKDIILAHKFAPENKLKVIANGSSNGIDTSYFHPESISDKQKRALRKSLGIGEDDFVFVFIGRLVKDKGLNELISVFSRLGSELDVKPKLLLVGSYEQELDPLLQETLQEINPLHSRSAPKTAL